MVLGVSDLRKLHKMCTLWWVALAISVHLLSPNFTDISRLRFFVNVELAVLYRDRIRITRWVRARMHPVKRLIGSKIGLTGGGLMGVAILGFFDI
jgi:hypothetical protein